MTETSSEELVLHYQNGSERALARLWARYVPRLTRWAQGRLSAAVRDHTSADDFVQDAFVRSLAPLRTLRPCGKGSVFAYFRRVVLNQMYDHLRRHKRHPVDQLVDDGSHVHLGASPLQEIMGQEAVARYERALESLDEGDRDLLTAAIELRCTDSELAELFEKPSANAARMARGRALARLARGMARADLVRTSRTRRAGAPTWW